MAAIWQVTGRIARGFEAAERARPDTIITAAVAAIHRHELYRIGREALVNAFFILEQSASSSNLNMPTAICACVFATMSVESIPSCSTRGAKDIGA